LTRRKTTKSARQRSPRDSRAIAGMRATLEGYQ
jgi:hypothetical protein